MGAKFDAIQKWTSQRARRAGTFVRKCAAPVPVLGPLVECTVEAHLKSLKEFIPSIAFSTATFWLSAIFLWALKENYGVGWFDLLRKTVDSGELLIFSLAFLGTIIVSAAEDPPGARTFPGRAWHFFFVFSIAVVAAGFYALQRVTKSSPLTELFDQDNVLTASVVIAICSLLLAYLTLVYRNQSFNPEKEIKEREEDFADAFARSIEQ